MSSHFNHLVAAEQIADRHRAAASQRLAAAAVSVERPVRPVEVGPLRRTRTLLGLRRRASVA